MTRIAWTPGSLRGRLDAALIGLLVLGVLLGTASAHTDGADHGTLTLHDSEDGEPLSSNATSEEPAEIACEFWVRGSNATHANGTIVASHDLGGPDAHDHEIGTWEGAENASGGWDFEAGPFTLHEDGDWLVRSATGAGGSHATRGHEVTYTTCEDHTEPLPGDDPHACEGPREVGAYNDGTAIAVTWKHHQDPEDTSHYEVYRSQAGQRNFSSIAQVDAGETSHRDLAVEAGTTYVYTVAAVDEETGREGDPCDHARITAGGERPACPEGLKAEAREDGDVALRWKRVDGADTYKVYRSTQETEFYQIATVQDNDHADPDTEEGRTYTYRVTAANEAGEATACPRLEATAIPSFPTAATLVSGTLAGVLAFATLRFRR